jgi:hypothetical protein
VINTRQKRRRTKAIKPTADLVSIHENLSEALSSFLKRENLSGTETKDALATLVGLLSSYREEGQHLFPEIFVFDDVNDIMQALPNSEQVRIGSGPKSSETVRLVLKRCAPLAQWGWSIYLLRSEEHFEYGLLRCGHTTLSLRASELLIDQGDESLPVILVRHISRHSIEILVACKNSLRIHYGELEESREDPTLIAKDFCSSIVAATPEKVKDQVRDFYWRLFSGVIRSGHGCLVAVMKPKRRALPRQLRDGVAIAPPLDVAAKVSSLLKAHTCEGDTKLRAIAALIRGMLSADGVTVLRADGSVCAYNVFVKAPRQESAVVTFGGARRRAFKALCGWVGKDLNSAFFLSQDGHAEWKGIRR